ncbi:amidase [Nocardia terpenica]|uniref:Amidase n=1 Tax=Nocardia terpenica TaxID=455432 RepID=A0A291RF94_9NOCA|nr:amidase [Nocardia terpenica]ATL66246.1 amidase [Nocardia terpenica]
MEWAYRTAEQTLAALRAGEVTSVELTEASIARIEKYDGAVNAICVPDFERARAAAREADAARARGEDRPLLGLPVTVKESYNIAGLPTTWGIPEFAGYLPEEDALQVSRLKAAGAVLLGKTNVPLVLRDWQSYNDIYGVTNNPWDLDRSPGGSSGGSAAALAAGYGALSLGSDIAGSLRVPAHFCGVYAHKPTYGLTPSRGHLAPGAPALPTAIDLAVVGPMARSARDLALLLDLMVAPDPLTLGLAYTVNLPAPRHDRLADFRVLVIDEHPTLPTGSSVRAGVERVAAALTAAGARVERHSPLLPDLTDTAALYSRLLTAALSANMPAPAYEQIRTAAAQLDPADDSPAAESLRGMVLGHRDWLAADARREQHRHGWRALFAEFDAVVCPVSPTPAFPHDHTDWQTRRITIDGVDYPYGDQMAWAGVATMSGLPATAIPAGRGDDGLPVGVQILGPMFCDRTPLRLAELLEREIGGFEPPALG